MLRHHSKEHKHLAPVRARRGDHDHGAHGHHHLQHGHHLYVPSMDAP